MSKPKKYTMDDKISIVQEAATGVETYELFGFFNKIGLNKKEISEKWFHTSLKTFQNYQKQEKRLDPQNSEILLKLSALFSKAEEIFGSIDAFNDWLDKPSHGLFGEIPSDLLRTITGIDLVYGELLRIEYGDFS